MDSRFDQFSSIKQTETIDISDDLSLYTSQPTVRPIVSADQLQIKTGELAWRSFLQSANHINRSRVLYFLWVKRILDLIGAIFLLIVLLPVFAIVAIFVRFQGTGQIIYRQDRVGQFGELFTMYKFSTMIPDRRKSKREFVGEDRRKIHKSKHDPRVTRIGGFLRKTSLDELPQLINILRGHMSFIGPRPEMPDIVSKYETWQHERHIVRPGLSGWWQVNGRSERPMHENTELDIYYVKNISFMLDLIVFVGTIRTLFSRSGAF